MNKKQIYTFEHLEILNNLSFEERCYILSHTDVEKQCELLMNIKERKILDTYPIRIWQATNGTWKAHVPDSSKPRNRRIIEGKTKEHLENNILKDYKKRNDDYLIFSNYFANWLINDKATRVQPATIQRNYDDYVKFVKGTNLDKMKITEIKRADVKELLNKSINEHNLTRRALSNLTSIFNGVFAYAIDKEDISINPMQDLKITNTNIKQEQVKTNATEVFNEEEFDLFLEYLYTHYSEHRPTITLAILLNFQLGLRVGELCAIKKSDVDFEHCQIHIQRMEQSYRPITLQNGELVKGNTTHRVVGRTKANSNRIIDLSDEAIAIINRAIELQKESSITSEYLFADEKGNNIIRQRINDCLAYYCKQLAIAYKSSHKIRKTVLSNLFSKGFDIDEIMQVAGHRQKSTTMKYYIFSVKLKNDRRARLNKALASNHCVFTQPQANPQISA